ncbi:MAG TPA: Sec-independent protein translocase subunit TatA [Dermatophilaceae bacterium]|nr:Sec-independent protein translocase subunit TatA [Dermatophilaceae bacterium]
MNLFREPSHFVVLIVLLALLFGWKRLPDMARSLGRSMRIFKSEVSEMKNDGTTAKPSPAAGDTVRAQAQPAAPTPTTPAGPPAGQGAQPGPMPAPQPVLPEQAPTDRS